MRNLCNKANVPYLLAGAFATLTLIASGALVAAPYVGFLSSVAAFNVALPIALSLSILSVLALALSYKMVSNNEKVDVEKNKFAQKEQELANIKQQLESRELENRITLEKGAREATNKVVQLNELTKENRDLKSNIERLNETIDQLKEQLTGVGQELEGESRKREQLEGNNKDAQKEVAELHRRVENSDDACNKLQRGLKDKQNELNNLNGEIVELNRKVDNLEGLQCPDDAYVNLFGDFKAKQNKLKSLESQINQIETFMKETIEFYELSGDYLSIVGGSSSIGGKFEEFFILLSTERGDMQRKLNVLTEKNQDLEDQVRDLEEKVKCSGDLKSSLLDGQKQLCEEIKEDAEKKIKKSDDLKVVAQKKLIERNGEVRELKQKLHQKMSLREDAEKEAERLNAVVERTKIELSALQQQLSQEILSKEAAEEKAEEFDEILSQKAQIIDELRSEITRLRREKDELIEKLHVSKTELKEVRLQDRLKEVNASEAENEQLRKGLTEESEDLLRELNQKVEDSRKRLEELKKASAKKLVGLSFTSDRGTKILQQINEGKNLCVELNEIIKAKNYLVGTRRNLEGQIGAYCESCGGLNEANNLLVQRIRDLEKELNKKKNRTGVRRRDSYSERFSNLQSKAKELIEEAKKLEKGKEDLNWLDTINSSTLLNKEGKKFFEIISNIIEMNKGLKKKIDDFNRLYHNLKALNDNLNRELLQMKRQKNDDSLGSQISSARNISEIESTQVNSLEYSPNIHQYTARKGLSRLPITSTPSKPCEGLGKFAQGSLGKPLSPVRPNEICSTRDSTSDKSGQSVLELKDQKGPAKKSKTQENNRTSLRKKDKENLLPQSQKNHNMSNVSVPSPLRNRTNILSASI